MNINMEMTNLTSESLTEGPLPWLSSSYERVVATFRQDRLPHALLIEGAQGVGKYPLAMMLSAFVLCERNKEQDLPCGQCKHCALFQTGSHGGFREIRRGEKDSVIKIDAIRSLSDFAVGTSYLGGYKVVVVNPAEDMNISAANALLKTLEEPSKSTFIILLSHSGGSLLPTIRSRCQSITVGMPSEQSVIPWLESQCSAEKPDIRRAVAMSSGSPLSALSLLETESLARVDKMLDELSLVLKRSVPLSEAAERWAKDGLEDYLLWLSQCAHQLVSYAMTGDDSLLVHTKSKKMFSYLAQRCSYVQLVDLYALCFAQLTAAKSTNNPNPVLTCERALSAWLALMLKSSQRA